MGQIAVKPRQSAHLNPRPVESGTVALWAEPGRVEALHATSRPEQIAQRLLAAQLFQSSLNLLELTLVESTKLRDLSANLFGFHRTVQIRSVEDVLGGLEVM